ncbi:peptidoglycan bridge formation protein FemAB [Enemella evansiae]|uniref:Peptidoglycan bridge formation protein FemAB n=1 Tax=Enemella evansiae TaxID=2016499 RepID=A0A255GSG1_9ACTN|nr:peptidoglycan bridge formation glycyltransferase FemA/FemB family protein [Enemella evansiae]OYO17576.1 peptidoglycan bridge formation protein FemAB [Enemella evansiae]
MTIQVRTIPASKHLEFIDSRPSASFLQTPAWAKVKSEWGSESLGFFDGENRLVGVALVLYRQVPKLKRYLAYLPEGPVLDWETADLAELLPALVRHCRNQGAFGVRIGPTIVARAWYADTIKAAIADPQIDKLSQATPDETNLTATRVHNELRHLGWLAPRPEGAGFAAGQPRFNFWLPLAAADGTPKTADELLKGMNQLWRRNIKKAEKAGVQVRRGGRENLARFHRIYTETAERDHFTPRPLSYFETMWDALGAEGDRIRLYLAEHEGDLVAATTWVRVGRHAWYSYGASTSHKREVRGSNAIQWRMITDALDAGATIYDLRGITEGLEADDPHLGLIQFKVGTGGRAVEYLGEWDLPINKPLYRAFDAYVNRGALLGLGKSLVRNPGRIVGAVTRVGGRQVNALRRLAKDARR